MAWATIRTWKLSSTDFNPKAHLPLFAGIAALFFFLRAESAAIFGLAATTLFCFLQVKRQKALAKDLSRAMETQIAKQTGRFETALNNMLHGLSMFDAEDRLVFCNAHYTRIYSLPQHFMTPGTPRTVIVAYLVKEFDVQYIRTSVLNPVQGEADPDTTGWSALCKFNDGRVIFIRHRFMEGGGSVASHEDVTEQQNAEARLLFLARHDALTGLPNRHVLQDRMDEALARSGDGEAFAVLCIDLDYFKTINDVLGHATGDLLLKEVAERLRSTVRAQDTVARIGGDEFAMVQTAITEPEDAAHLARRIVERLSRPYEIEGYKMSIGASVGIACGPRDGTDGPHLLSRADMALYRAKADGRRSFRFFEPGMDAVLQTRHALEQDMRQAIERHEFELYFQPLVDPRTRTITSFEALMRWNHPTRGLTLPSDFIPLLEETGLIIPLGAWALKRACEEALAWPDTISVSANVSVKQFIPGNLVETVAQALTATGLPPGRLELEITESVLLHQEDKTLATLHAIRALGVKIVMDDFGTGYSSLNYLRVFPFDKIKIDKSFIQNLDKASANAIVQAIAHLGKTLGIRMTAEGIETATHLAGVLEHGFDEAQGYLFGYPAPAGLIPKYRDGNVDTAILA